MTGFVYMTASQKRGTIYIGVANDLARRMPEHYRNVTAWILGSPRRPLACFALG